MKKQNKKIIIGVISILAITLIFLAQKAVKKSNIAPAQLITTGANLAGEKAMEAISDAGVPLATQEAGLQELP